VNKLIVRSLRSRLFLAVFVIGLATMSALSAGKAYVLTRRAQEELGREIDRESTTHLLAVAEALWVYDVPLLKALTNGIAAGPNISYVAVVDEQKLITESGLKREADAYTREMPIVHAGRGSPTNIGTLVVQGDIREIQRRSTAWLIEDLPLSAFGILLLSVLISVYFSRKVTSRLFAAAEALESYDEDGEHLPFPLGTIPAEDEISLLETKFDESILALRASLQEKETLLRELYHRTNNNMQTILGLLSLGAPRVTDAGGRRLIGGIEAKVYAMALVHRMLYEQQNLSSVPLGDYIRQFAAYAAESENAAERNIQLEFSLAEAEATVDYALPFGLALSELASNAMRHAFPDGRGGTVRFELSWVGADTLLFTLSDDGVGSDLDLNKPGSEAMGIDLAASLVKSQLGGDIEFKSAPGAGCACFIRTKPGKFRARV